jgi:hypothetical protein
MAACGVCTFATGFISGFFGPLVIDLDSNEQLHGMLRASAEPIPTGVPGRAD